jgi:mannose-1-phosphate guanylyltransferase
MVGFVLAAGFGTRLKPITNRLPKSLVPVCGISLLDRALAKFRNAGIMDIVVNSHHLHHHMQVHRSASAIPYALSHEAGGIRGTGGALHHARDLLAQSDMFIVYNVDIVSNVDLTGLIAAFRASGSMCCLAAVPVRQGGTIVYDQGTKLFCGICKDGMPEVPGAQGLFYGVALYSPRFLDLLREDDFSIIPVWKRARERGMAVSVIETPEVYWRDTGTPSALAGVHFDVLEGKSSLPVPESMIIDRQRLIAYPAGLDNSKIRGFGRHVWVDSGSIPDGCIISHSVVMDDVALAAGSIMHNTLLTPWGTCSI